MVVISNRAAADNLSMLSQRCASHAAVTYDNYASLFLLLSVNRQILVVVGQVFLYVVSGGQF